MAKPKPPDGFTKAEIIKFAINNWEGFYQDDLRDYLRKIPYTTTKGKTYVGITDKTTIKRHLKELKELDYLECVRRGGGAEANFWRLNPSKLHEILDDHKTFKTFSEALAKFIQTSENVLEYITNQYEHLLVEEKAKEEFKEHLMSSPAFFRWMVHPDRKRLEELLRGLGSYIIFFYDYFLGYRDTPWNPERHPVLKRCQTVEKLRLLYAITKAVDILEGRAGAFSFGATMLECEIKYYLVSELIQLVEIFDEVKFLAKILGREKDIQELEANLNSLRDQVLIARAIIDKAERDEYQRRVEELHEKVSQLRNQLRQELQEIVGKSGLGCL